MGNDRTSSMSFRHLRMARWPPDYLPHSSAGIRCRVRLRLASDTPFRRCREFNSVFFCLWDRQSKCQLIRIVLNDWYGWVICLGSMENVGLLALPISLRVRDTNRRWAWPLRVTTLAASGYRVSSLVSFTTKSAFGKWNEIKISSSLSFSASIFQISFFCNKFPAVEKLLRCQIVMVPSLKKILGFLWKGII